MKVVVCIKPVKTELVYPNEIRDEAFLMNPYDLFALERCIELKKSIDCKIICLCMGPKSAQDMLVKALAMGADEAILLNHNAFSGSDTVATSYILASAIEKIKDVDMVICGEKTIDGETGQVVCGIGTRLGYPSILAIKQITGINDETRKVVARKTEDNKTETICFGLPAVISFNDFMLNQPSISLIALKKAKRREIIQWGVDEINVDITRCGLNGSKTRVLNIKNELVKKEKQIIEGSINDKVKIIFDVINGKI